MKPTIGRIVHFKESAVDPCQAAIVVAAKDDVVNVVLFRDGSNDTQQGWGGGEPVQWRTAVPSSDNEREGTAWHWPEREAEEDAKSSAAARDAARKPDEEEK